MIFRRGGATTSLVLGIAGVIGVGVAGAMALTGTTPCSLLSSCGDKSAAPAAQTVALQSGESCPVTGASMAAAAKESSCCDVMKKDAAPAAAVAQTVALAADCSKEPGCENDDNKTCSKDTECHKATQASATPVAMTGEVCAMAASCEPSKCTTEMVKACTDSGKICPLGEAKVVPASMTASAECSKEPGCENDDDKTCSKNTECHKAQPVALNAASTCSDAAKATCASTTAVASTCSSTVAAAATCSSATVGKVIAVASAPASSCGTPMPIGTLRTLAYTGKGMPMLIPAAFANVQSVETKAAGCGGCSDKAATPGAPATPVAQPVALKADCSKEPGCENDDDKTCSKGTECHKAVASR